MDSYVHEEIDICNRKLERIYFLNISFLCEERFIKSFGHPLAYMEHSLYENKIF